MLFCMTWKDDFALADHARVNFLGVKIFPRSGLPVPDAVVLHLRTNIPNLMSDKEQFFDLDSRKNIEMIAFEEKRGINRCARIGI